MRNFCLFPKLDNKNLHSSSAATQSDPFVSFVCLKLFISASGRRFVDVIQRGLIVRGDIESFESFLDFISDKISIRKIILKLRSWIISKELKPPENH